MSVNTDLLRAIADYFLIRDTGPWTGERARQVIVLGPDEVARAKAVLRDMATGEEREVSLEELR